MVDFAVATDLAQVSVFKSSICVASPKLAAKHSNDNMHTVMSEVSHLRQYR